MAAWLQLPAFNCPPLTPTSNPNLARLQVLGDSARGTWLELPNSTHMDGYVVDKAIYLRGVQKFFNDHVYEGPIDEK